MTRSYREFFKEATGFAKPFKWQEDVAKSGLPGILSVPTGLGKTEGAVLAWAWRRVERDDRSEPLHLIYCLPMRTLVTQTAERLGWCLCRVLPEVAVHTLMGGSIDERWAARPDVPWVLVGTQDQLLSRALNRGYAMSRYQWPVHFGLLNQDCHWIVDEVQLMGPGLWTTAQLDWMRAKRFAGLKPCKTTWMSATVGSALLKTVDRHADGIDSIDPWEPDLDADRNEELERRRSARRHITWFEPSAGKRAPSLAEQMARNAHAEHSPGTLTLIVCNTVDMAQQVYRALPEGAPRALLTSRMRSVDRKNHEKLLLDLERWRAEAASKGEPIVSGSPGLICVSTQVVEAGLDISARRLWSELAPWPSLIQRLGRLNRDGRDNDQAAARFWKTPKTQETRREGMVWVGPYEKPRLEAAATLLADLFEPSARGPFANAVERLQRKHSKRIDEELEPRPAPLPRALDLHGLFSTEQDLHGGFTDVSAFVRGADPDADLAVFWRRWPGTRPAPGDALDGPPFAPHSEACPVAFHRVRAFIDAGNGPAWTWNDESDTWEQARPRDLRPGMVVMLHERVGGYDSRLGWTGQSFNVPYGVPMAGPGRALRGDERTEAGFWSRLDAHLRDARKEADALCDALGLAGQIRAAVVEAAALHDIGKAHPSWQTALPASGVVAGGPWAKCPRVLGVDVAENGDEIHEAVRRLRPHALFLSKQQRRPGQWRLRWAVDPTLTPQELEVLRAVRSVRWAGLVPFRPGLRHEAASAMAMWARYRRGRASYPALAVYLAASHHGKVRTVLRATTDARDDVFGVGRDPAFLSLEGSDWALDFSLAADGSAGTWGDDHFELTGFGWTGLVADLLGPWRSRQEDRSDIGAVPENEPRSLGPFALAWLEAIVRAVDWRASERPSSPLSPNEVTRDE